MLALCVLIVCALGIAVTSFVGSAAWLLFASAGLVLVAFLLSWPTSRGRPGSDSGTTSGPPVREHLTVTIDPNIIEDDSGRHRPAPTGDQPAENGQAIAS